MSSPLGATSSTTNTPVEINKFFETLYSQVPQVTQDKKKNTIYAIPEKGVSIATDPFGGCHIDITAISSDQLATAQTAIATLSESFKISKAFDSIWINLPLPVSVQTLGIAPSSFKIGEPGKGDLIYDYQENKLRIWQWLNPSKECTIPPGSTHNIGATALMIDRVAQKVLLVVNQRRDDSWNMPGGTFDLRKDKTSSDTALREAQEEGGFILGKNVTIEPKLMGQLQFPQNRFASAINQVWAFCIDGISQTPLNPPAHEIKLAEWISFEEIAASKGNLKGLKISEEIQTFLIGVTQGLGFEKIIDKKWMIVHAPRIAT